MPKKKFDIEIVVHFPEDTDNISYNEIHDKFRIEQIKRAIAKYPPKVQLAMLEWLEVNIVAFE